MSITKMNVLDIMAESVKTSVVNTDNQTIDEMANSVTEQVRSLDEMDIEIKFTPEMVPVVFDEADGKYFVEYDMLAKLHECDDSIEVETKYGKIKFEPKKDDDDEEEEKEDKGEEDEKEEEKDKEEPINEEEPEEPEYPNEIDESFMHHHHHHHGHNPFHTDDPCCCPCWEKDALNQVILANLVRDPNREEIDKKNGCEVPEMTMENTYVVIESEEELCERINSVSEAAKSGGVALKNGKAQLIKADEAFRNMINHGIKVVKKKSSSKSLKEESDYFQEAYWDSRDVRKQCKDLKKTIKYAERLADRGDTKEAKKEFDKAREILKRLKKQADMVDNDSAWDLIVRFLILNGWAVFPIHVIRMIKNNTITTLNRKEAQAACDRLDNQLKKCEMKYFD